MTTTDGIKTAGFAKESGHWYAQDGKLVESVPYANGKLGKKPTLYDARKFDLAPGVTTIMREKAQPGLERWKIRQHVLAALTLTRQPDENDDAFLARVEADAAEQARNAAAEGTRIHAALESSYRGESIDPAYQEHVDYVKRLVADVCGDDVPWLAERGFAHPFGFGTKVDLHSERWVLDFKGKDGDQAQLDRERVYDSHWMQLAAGREIIAQTYTQDGYTMTGHRCAIVYVSRTHPGACSLVEVTEEQLQRGWGMFTSCLRLWQARTGYMPAWADDDWRASA